MIRFVFLSLICSSLCMADHHTKYGLGYLSEEEALHLEKTAEKVIEVKPNSLGKERLQRHGKAVPEENNADEFCSAQGSTRQIGRQIPSKASLPTSVNNSLLPSFPPIGDQGRLGACVGFGSTYYQATHEIGLANGYNNKTSQDHILSPKWTYDMINGGVDQGSSVVAAYALLSSCGAASLTQFPYDSNYTAWDLRTQDWISALSNRTAPYVLIPGLDGNLTAIKQALNNGHVLTFATFIDSWVYTTIKRDRNRPSTPHQGEYAAVYMNGQRGGHFMTIVGYDDDLWIDVNGNGVEDPGERGAFLVANSWGTQWGNAGFIWVSYDAFLSISKVKKGPSRGRVPLGFYLNSSVIAINPKAVHYTPKLVGTFSLTQSDRGEIAITAGASSTTQTNPSKTFSLPALANQGGDLTFSGKTPTQQETVTFAVDLTDLIALSPQRYYLTTKDNRRGNPTILNSFTLVDLTHQTQVQAAGCPRIYDKSQGSVYVDYNFQLGKAK